MCSMMGRQIKKVSITSHGAIPARMSGLAPGRVTRIACICAAFVCLPGCSSGSANPSNQASEPAQRSEQVDRRIYVRCDERGRTEFIGDSKELGPVEAHGDIYRIDPATRRVDVWFKSRSAFKDRCNLSSYDDNSCTLSGDDTRLTFTVSPSVKEVDLFETEILAFDRLNGAFEHQRSRIRFVGDGKFGFTWKGKGQCSKVEPPTSAPAKF
jgi:hypothetical protein